MITRNIALVNASQHLMMNVYNFAKEMSDQVNYGKQYNWNSHSQEETITTNGASTMLIDMHHDNHRHHYQRMYIFFLLA